MADLSALARFDSLRRGVISLADILYFLSLMGLGLGLAMALIDARRGRRAMNRTRFLWVMIFSLILGFAG